MDPLIRFSAMVILGALIFTGSLWLPWESWRDLPLTSGWEVISTTPVLPYLPALGELLAVTTTLCTLFNLLSGRILKLMGWMGFVFLLLGLLWCPYKLYELTREFGGVGRGVFPGFFGAVLSLVGLRKLLTR